MKIKAGFVTVISTMFNRNNYLTSFASKYDGSSIIRRFWNARLLPAALLILTMSLPAFVQKAALGQESPSRNSSQTIFSRPRISQNIITKNAPAKHRMHLIGCAAKGMISDLGELGTIFAGRIRPALSDSLREDVNELRRLYGVRAPMMLLNEKGNANAVAVDIILVDELTRRGLDPNDYADGTVFLGTKLINAEFAEGHGAAYSIPTILGHEFAHILQKKLKFPLVESKWQELHADYMAGWFTGHRARYRKQDLNQSIQSLFEKGDYEFNSVGHHGTPVERSCAFDAGYRLNRDGNVSSARLAYVNGLRYLMKSGAPMLEAPYSGSTGDSNVPFFLKK